MKRIKLDTRNLNAIKALLIVLIVCIHVSPDNLSTNKIIDSGLSVQVYISQVLSRVAVPLYFFFSGYLLSINYNSLSAYSIKIKKRIKTLLIPYVLWNALYAIFLVLLYKFGHITSFLDSETSFISKLSLIFVAPAISPLWFLRDLMLFQLVSILLFYVPRKFRVVLVCLLLLIWGFYFHFPNTIISVEGALFFVLGFYNLLPLYKFAKGKIKVLIVVASILSLFDIFVRYAGLDYSLLFHRFTVYLLCILFIYATTQTQVFNRIFNKMGALQKYSFYIFVLHVPILSFLKRFLNQENLIFYIVMILVSITLSMALGFLINKFPKISNILTGNR